MKKNAVVTYIYKEALPFLSSFSETLRAQNFQDFDLIVFNDGVEEESLNFEWDGNLSVYNLAGTILEVRLQSLEVLRNLAYDKFIFSDMDDSMTSNRTEEVFKALSDADLVCNDLNLMNEAGEVYQEGIWKTRLNDRYSFNVEFIKDKNIVGFGNTGINRGLLNFNLKYDSKPLVSDWFIFYQLMKVSQCSGLFISKCQTNYRQHSRNDAGIRSISFERLAYVKKVIEAQLSGLRSIGMEIEDIRDIDINNLNLKTNYETIPFWWEEIKIAYEKN